MQPKSNARFLGNIISQPLQIVNFNLKEQDPFDYQSSIPLGDMLEDGYSKAERECKGCMGPCGQCDEQSQGEAEEIEVRKLTA